MNSGLQAKRHARSGSIQHVLLVIAYAMKRCFTKDHSSDNPAGVSPFESLLSGFSRQNLTEDQN